MWWTRFSGKILGVAGAAMLLGCTGGGDGTEVDIRGLSNEEAAAVFAESVCGYLARCGEQEMVCSSSCDRQGHCEDRCEVVTDPVDYDECVTEVEGQVHAALDCADLTPEQQAVVNQCLNHGYVDRECLSEEEKQDLADRAERGEDVDLEDPACEQMQDYFNSCYPVRRVPEDSAW